MRNYAVLRIPPNEAKLFKTKERAPMLLCVELYRPDEINQEILDEIETKKENPPKYSRSKTEYHKKSKYFAS
jgi:hypothetical protein